MAYIVFMAFGFSVIGFNVIEAKAVPSHVEGNDEGVQRTRTTVDRAFQRFYLDLKFVKMLYSIPVDDIQDEPFHPFKVGSPPEKFITGRTIMKFMKTMVNGRIDPVPDGFPPFR